MANMPIRRSNTPRARIAVADRNAEASITGVLATWGLVTAIALSIYAAQPIFWH